MSRKLLPGMLVGMFMLVAHANDTAPANRSDPAELAVRAALKALAPKADIDSLKPSALPGFYEVFDSGQLVYVSADGKYLLHGDLVDLTSKTNLGDAAWATFRKAELAKVPASQRIVFAPVHPKYVVTVFTDVNCPYCRVLHQQIGALNRAGIEVDYLAWPREGVTTTAGNLTPTYKEMVSVWCASDRKSALTSASQSKAPSPATCSNPVQEQYELGLRLGIDGTPTIIGPDGNVLGGYVAPDDLLKMLRQGAGG